MNTKYDCINVLKNSNVSWVRYNMGFENNASIILEDERVQSIINEAMEKDNVVLKRHNDSKHPIHKITLLADLGLTKEYSAIKDIAKMIMSNQVEEGAFLSKQNIPTNFGGAGYDRFDWIICDFPTLLYSLIKFGYKEDERVVKAIQFLKALADDNGFRCYSSIKKFGGPGKKADHCPYSNLLALKVFSLLPEYHEEKFIKNALQSLLLQWETQGQRKYRMFGIGTDFKKLKFPYVWFNILHVVSVLSNFEYAVKSNEFKEMLIVITDKQLENGGFIPESIYMTYKDWDFGQKKIVSDTLTYEIYQIFKNINTLTVENALKTRLIPFFEPE